FGAGHGVAPCDGLGRVCKVPASRRLRGPARPPIGAVRSSRRGVARPPGVACHNNPPATAFPGATADTVHENDKHGNYIVIARRVQQSILVAASPQVTTQTAAAC